MGVFDRVKFWKQSEEPSNTPPEYDLGARQFDTSNPNGAPPLDPGYGADPLAQHDPLQQAGNQQFSQQSDSMFGQEPQQYPSQPFAQQYPGSTPFPGSQQQSQQPQQGYPPHTKQDIFCQRQLV